jgi:hypothetical protein
MIEARVITPGKYWTVYDRKQYQGAIAYHDDMFFVVKAGVKLGPADSMEAALKLFEFPVTK